MDFVNRKKFIKNIKLGLKEACEKYFSFNFAYKT